MICISDIEIFQKEHPSLESYWRSIILFGSNSATYKFALSKSILKITPTLRNEISLEELAIPYSKYLCQHIANSPKQNTNKSSAFLQACKDYNNNLISQDKLWDITVKKGFNNVLDAFHTVNRNTIPIHFFEYERGMKKIILTDEVFGLLETHHFGSLKYETEARWNLVETAWEMGVSKNLLGIQYNHDKRQFFVDSDLNRKDVTSARNALNGYQKGKCFYCFRDISVEKGSPLLCDVDHFFPHILKKFDSRVNINGVWNLVLACPKCNRGQNGKSANVPDIKYLERLSRRNEYLINSHHPLRETLIQQTGISRKQREAFLQGMNKFAIEKLIHYWKTEQVGEEIF